MSNYTWNEADHPRDDEGKFTYKNGTSSSNSIKDRIEKQNKEREEFERAAEILYPNMKIAKNTSTPTFAPKQEYDYKKEEIIKKAEDILYPTMKNRGCFGGNQIVMNHLNTDLGGELLSLKNDKLKRDDSCAKKANENLEYGAKYLFYRTGIATIGDKIVREGITRIYGLETAENLYMSKKDHYMNTEYAKKHLVLDNYRKLGQNLGNYFKGKIIEQLHLENLSETERQKILDNTKGIYIEPNSSSSKLLSSVLVKEPEFRKLMKETKSIGDLNKSEVNIEFKDNNFYHALGHVDFKNFKINKRGDLSVLVTDVYDFNPKPETPLLKAGRDAQLKGEIKPYFAIYDVIIKKEDLDKL